MRRLSTGSFLTIFACAILSGCGGGGTSSGSGEPRENQPCFQTDECESDEICSAIGECIPQGDCFGHADCGEEEMCNAPANDSSAGACIEIQTCDGGCPAGMECATSKNACIPSSTCFQHSDCDQSVDICSTINDCVARPDCDIETNECIGGTFCSDELQECIPLGRCGNSQDCTASEICNESGICDLRPDCTESACPDADTTFCSFTGYCIPNGECRQNGDCESGEMCANRTCVADTGCTSSAVCDEGFICDTMVTPHECVLDNACGSEGEIPTAVSAPLLILLDRSVSMTGLIKDGVQVGVKNSKWYYAVNAVQGLIDQLTQSDACSTGNDLASFANKGQIGLIPFPDPIGRSEGGNLNDCVQEEFSLDYSIDSMMSSASFPMYIGPGTVPAVCTLLGDSRDDVESELYPNGPPKTPIYNTLLAAQMEPMFAGEGEGRYIILVSDGKESCHREEVDTMIDMITDLRVTHGVTTFVLGFGSGINEEVLTQFAVAGGAPVPLEEAPPWQKCSYGDRLQCRFYFAESGQDFRDKILQIGTQVRSCTHTFRADEQPDKTTMGVYINGTRIVLDASEPREGWDMTYSDPDGDNNGEQGTGTVTFYGSYCDQLRTSEEEQNVTVITGCPPVVPG